MLVTRLFRWFKRRQTLQVFPLEIAAIFVGITASLVVDDWRQNRETDERLHNLIQEINFDRLLANIDGVFRELEESIATLNMVTTLLIPSLIVISAMATARMAFPSDGRYSGQFLRNESRLGVLDPLYVRNTRGKRRLTGPQPYARSRACGLRGQPRIVRASRSCKFSAGRLVLSAIRWRYGYEKQT